MSDNRKHIVSFSAGKDSVAMLLKMHENNMPIDEIIYFDVESWNWPQCNKVIEQVENIVGKKIIRLKGSKENYFDWYMCFKPITRGKNEGTIGVSWPGKWKLWCTSQKATIIDKYKKENYKDGYIGYLGYCINEKKRAEATSVKSLETKNVEYRFPLIDWNMTEEDTLKYCYDKGINWGGLYNYVKRVSCFCCPFQSVESLRILYNNFPDSWKELERKQQMIYDNVTGEKWVDYKCEHNVFEWSNRFRLEKKIGRKINKWDEMYKLLDKEDYDKALEDLIKEDPDWNIFK